ncbi:MAG TPA: signal peptidase II [Firmicutes bacterium]|nr:signal peptidase II [Bacillota bacterium]
MRNNSGGVVLGYFYIIILLIIGFDQTTKFLIHKYLALNQGVHIIPGVLSFTHIKNPGAAFGILPNKTFVLILLTLVLFMFVFFFRKKIPEHPFSFRLGLALGLGGAAGNLIDRLRTGLVIDFLDVDFWPLQNFPIFNFADTAIFIGVVMVFWYLSQLEN